MPTDHNKITTHPGEPLDPDLVQDLETVAAMVRESADSVSSSKNKLALVRVLEGVSMENWERFASANGLESWLSIPLDGSLASSVASLLSVQERLAFQRDHDALTGIGNRRLFDRRFEAEVTRAIRSRTELSLIILDLDNFKKVNDTYGHTCGDVVLKRLGAFLKESVRHYDIAARIGGEEFAIILPATSCWTALMLGNRLLEFFRQEVFHCGDVSFSMTFSAGVSSLALLDGDPGSALLLQSADGALYAAKGQGKDRVTIAECNKLAKDRGSLVLSQEKQFLFSCQGLE